MSTSYSRLPDTGSIGPDIHSSSSPAGVTTKAKDGLKDLRTNDQPQIQPTRVLYRRFLTVPVTHERNRKYCLRHRECPLELLEQYKYSNGYLSISDSDTVESNSVIHPLAHSSARDLFAAGSAKLRDR